VMNPSIITRGDADNVFASAHLIVRTTVRSQRVHQGYIEPRAALAELTERGLVITTSSQAPFSVRASVAAFLDISPSDIVVRAPAVGGGFGGKLQRMSCSRRTRARTRSSHLRAPSARTGRSLRVDPSSMSTPERMRRRRRLLPQSPRSNRLARMQLTLWMPGRTPSTRTLRPPAPCAALAHPSSSTRPRPT
jgi:hypothetical protein